MPATIHIIGFASDSEMAYSPVPRADSFCPMESGPPERAEQVWAHKLVHEASEFCSVATSKLANFSTGKQRMYCIASSPY